MREKALERFDEIQIVDRCDGNVEGGWNCGQIGGVGSAGECAVQFAGDGDAQVVAKQRQRQRNSNFRRRPAVDFFARILQGFLAIVEILRGHYAQHLAEHVKKGELADEHDGLLEISSPNVFVLDLKRRKCSSCMEEESEYT